MFPIRDHNPSRSWPIVTILLIGANLYVFWLELNALDLDAFLFQYALVPSTANFSDFSSLSPFVTSMFLHGGWLHLISNMWFLWIFGDNVEERFGKIRYLLMYFGSGIIAGLSQYAVMPSSSIPMLGASGAVAGVLGSYIFFYPRHRIDTFVPFFGFFQIMRLPATLMIGYWFLTQVLSGFGSLAVRTMGGVAFFAHIGGFIAGLLFAILLRPFIGSRKRYAGKLELP